MRYVISEIIDGKKLRGGSLTITSSDLVSAKRLAEKAKLYDNSVMEISYVNGDVVAKQNITGEWA